MAGVDLNRLIEGAKNRQLQNQVAGGKAKVSAMGGKVKKGGPSILSRVFDVISRPLYGVSEGLARASEAKNPGEIGKGIIGGLAGKNKTDFGDTLLRAAEHSPNSLLSRPLRENRFNLRSIAGLAGDVVLDPLTWTGAGIVKSGGKAAADVAKLKAIKDVALSADSIKAIEEASNLARVAKAESMTQRAAKGLKVAKDGEKAIESAGKVAGKAERARIWQEAEKGVGQAAFDAAKTNAPGKVQLKFGGKVVGESEKLYRGTAKLGEIVGSTKAGKSLNEAFRTASKFPELTNKIRREVQLAGIAHAQQEMHALLFGTKGVEGVKDFAGFHKLTPHELEMVSHAAEAGPVKQVTHLTPEGGVPVEEIVKPSSLHGVKGENVDDLGEYVDKMKEITNQRFEDEFNAGVFRHEDGKLKTREEAFREGYVPHYYKNAVDEEDAIRRANKAIGPDKPGFTKVRKIDSLKDAVSKGLDPHVRADEILVKRIGASHRAIARAKYADAVAKEYGQELGSSAARRLAEKSGYRAVDSPYISKNMVFPPHIAQSFDVLDKMHTNDELYRGMLKVFDTAQNKLKFWQTAANPGHHVRNAVGDIWQNFALGGVTNPHRYEQSFHILTKPETFKMKVGKGFIDGKTLLGQWIERGAKPGFTLGELEVGEKGVFKGLKGKIAVGSEKREEFTRMANFLEQMKKYGKDLDPASPTFAKDLDEAGSKAAAEVRRINIDYGDLTDFERNVAKRVMPFYTWSRKNIPLQVEALALHPGRVAAIPKGTAAIQRMMGTDVGYNQTDPLAVIPKYLKEMAGVRLRGEGEGKNAIYWVPSLPFQDISKYLEGGEQGIAQSILSQVTPFARVPFEKATGKQVFSGSKTPGNTQLASSQIPLLNQLYNIAKGKQKPASIKTLNYLTGAGAYEITPGQVSGELRRQQDQTQSIIRNIRAKAQKR